MSDQDLITRVLDEEDPELRLTDGEAGEILRILERWPESLHRITGLPYCYAPIHTYCRSAPMIHALIKAGADIELRDQSNQTPLFHAAMSGNVRTAQLLLERGANPRAETWANRIPWHYIDTRNNADGVKMRLLFLKHGGMPQDAHMLHRWMIPHLVLLALCEPIDAPRLRKTPWLPRDVIRRMAVYLVKLDV